MKTKPCTKLRKRKQDDMLLEKKEKQEDAKWKEKLKAHLRMKEKQYNEEVEELAQAKTKKSKELA
jgi:hypothetical protein